MAPGVDTEARTVTVLGLEAGSPPALKIAMNVEAQRIAAHLGLPTREFKRLMEEYPSVVEPALGLAAVRRELGKDCPGAAEFLADWTIIIEERPDPTSPPSPGNGR
jgi:hypothetical protein